MNEKDYLNYLIIEVKELGDVPRVYYKGKEVEAKRLIDFKWRTKELDELGKTELEVSYLNKDDKDRLITKSIKEGIIQ